MKRMKLIALVISLVMLLSACNAVNVTEVATVGDEAMFKPEFMYYLQSAKSEAMQEAQAKGLSITSDKDWETVMIGDKTAAQFAKDRALQSIKTIMVMEAKGKAEGFVLSETDVQSIASQKEQIITQLGGRYAYEQALEEMGITLDALDTIVERSVYANAYMTQYSAEDTSLTPTEDEIKAKYENEYVFVRHILISNQPPLEVGLDAGGVLEGEGPATEVEQEDPEKYAEEAKAKAEGILKELADGADFVALMNEHSEDARDDAGKLTSDGYVMTDNGQMVAEFEEAAMNLEIGKYTTELVETDYGYHILMRYELPTSGEQYDSAISAAKSALASDKLTEKINAWAEEIGFLENSKYFEKLKIKMEG